MVEDPVQRFNALKAGSLDAIATTPDTFSRTTAQGIKTVQVLGLDASVGGDGIVAENSIKSVADLKGQKVGVSAGSTSQWFLAYVLDQDGMSLKDVEQVDMTSGDAGSAFATGKIPAAVTWEPWLSKTQKNPDGHVVVSTEKYPKIITDQVAFDPEFLKQNPDSVRAFVKGYLAAVDFLKSDPDKAFEDVDGLPRPVARRDQGDDEDGADLGRCERVPRVLRHQGRPRPDLRHLRQVREVLEGHRGDQERCRTPKTAIDPSFIEQAGG